MVCFSRRGTSTRECTVTHGAYLVVILPLPRAWCSSTPGSWRPFTLGLPSGLRIVHPGFERFILVYGPLTHDSHTGFHLDRPVDLRDGFPNRIRVSSTHFANGLASQTVSQLQMVSEFPSWVRNVILTYSFPGSQKWRGCGGQKLAASFHPLGSLGQEE